MRQKLKYRIKGQKVKAKTIYFLVWIRNNLSAKLKTPFSFVCNIIRKIRFLLVFLTPFFIAIGLFIAWRGYIKVDLLSKTAQIYQLADNSAFNRFTGGSASNYESLVKIVMNEIKANPVLKELFKAKLEEIKNSYTNNPMYKEIIEITPLCKWGTSVEECRNGAIEKPEDMDLKNIMNHVDYLDFWNSRVKATRFLRKVTNTILDKYKDITWEKILQKIIDRIMYDVSLAVRIENVETYVHIVHPSKRNGDEGFLRDFFDFDWVLKDWQTNKDSIIQNLKKVPLTKNN